MMTKIRNLIVSAMLLALVCCQAHAQTPCTNATITIQNAAAIHGWAMFANRDTDANGFTLFCSVVVDNRTGETITFDPMPGRAGRSSVFDTLFLCVCDETGNTTSRNPYLWQEISSLPRYASLLQGQSTNRLFYFVPFKPPTNGHVNVRLEGGLGTLKDYCAGLTSNIVKAKLY